MRLRWSSLLERVRASLFFVPMASVIVAIVVGQAGLTLDHHLESTSSVPFVLTSTVDNARAVLTTVAAATITFAGIAFSVSLLVIQLGSSQYSPRVVHTLFRDPFNKRVMGLVVGTFAYCLVVLRSVRSIDGGDAVVPNLSVAFAVLLGIVAILGVVAFIDHSAHSMDISEILQRATTESIATIRAEWDGRDDRSHGGSHGGSHQGSPSELAAAPFHAVAFRRSGWVQQVDVTALLRCIPEDGVLSLETFPGRYAIAGTPLCTISPVPDDPDEIGRRVAAAIGIGNTRTMQQDVSYGLRQLVDVALKALSPGVNDPTTAQDAMLHATSVLRELLARTPPPVVRTGEANRRLVLRHQHTHDELVRLTFEEVRRAAEDQPTFGVYLLEMLAVLHENLAGEQRFAGSTAPAALEEQARLVLAGADAAGLVPDDRAAVRDAYTKRFGPVNAAGRGSHRALGSAS